MSAASPRSIAIITARGGSKRIPRKNIRPFLGAPIISYPLRALLDSGCFREVMVSTDDPEIRETALALGASVPFLRSAENSSDQATTASAVTEVLEQYRKLGHEFDHFLCAYPTAALLSAAKVRLAMDKLAHPDIEAVVPVVRYGHPIQRAFQMEQGLVRMVQPEYVSTRSQDLPARYHDSGQFYAGKTSAFLKSGSLFPPRTAGIEVAENEVQDIDNEVDWLVAEAKYSALAARGR